jgi:hypothetical protein
MGGTTTHSVGRGGRLKSPNYLRMVSQPQVIIAAESQIRAAIDTDLGSLWSFQYLPGTV